MTGDLDDILEALLNMYPDVPLWSKAPQKQEPVIIEMRPEPSPKLIERRKKRMRPECYPFPDHR